MSVRLEIRSPFTPRSSKVHHLGATAGHIFWTLCGAVFRASLTRPGTWDRPPCKSCLRIKAAREVNGVVFDVIC